MLLSKSFCIFPSAPHRRIIWNTSCSWISFKMFSPSYTLVFPRMIRDPFKRIGYYFLLLWCFCKLFSLFWSVGRWLSFHKLDWLLIDDCCSVNYRFIFLIFCCGMSCCTLMDFVIFRGSRISFLMRSILFLIFKCFIEILFYRREGINSWYFNFLILAIVGCFWGLFNFLFGFAMAVKALPLATLCNRFVFSI